MVSGPTAARDAIDALSALLDAQNGLLNVFVNYEVVRRGLVFDMGTMELTPEGLWIDPGEISAGNLLDLPGTTVGGMGRVCNDCCLPNMPQPQEPDFGNAFIENPAESTPARQLEEVSGLMESDSASIDNPVHVARLPDVWESNSHPVRDNTAPILLPPEVNILSRDDGQIESP